MSKTVVILIHGYNVSDPRRSVGKFREYFEALDCLVENYTYGYWPFPWQLTKRNPKMAREVAERVKYWKAKGWKVCIACHSNGAVIARMASVLNGAPIDRILAIHPALRSNMVLSKDAERVLIVHNEGDKAVKMGGFLGKISKFFVPDSWVFRPWGSMGSKGHTGASLRHKNVDSGDRKWDIRCWGHGDEFKPGKAEYWLPLLANMLLE